MTMNKLSLGISTQSLLIGKLEGFSKRVYSSGVVLRNIEMKIYGLKPTGRDKNLYGVPTRRKEQIRLRVSEISGT